MSFFAAPAEPRVLIPLSIGTRAPALGGVVHALAGATMGTTWSVRLVGSPGLPIAPIRDAIERELDLIVAQMSPWEAASDIGRFNRAAPGRWQTLPAEFAEVLQCALSVARDSGGAYDPAAGAIVNAWGFGPERRYNEPGFTPPGDEDIADALALSGWQRLAFDAAPRRVRQPGGLQLDLSAIAKGYAVDRIAQLLPERFGIEDLLVEVGGELRGIGLKPDGQPWWVALEAAPRWHDGGWQPDPSQPATRIALHGLSVATSGEHRRFFKRADRHFAHTIDPRHGRPVAHGVALVTVLHASCMCADALSTALTVLGVEEGLAFAEQRDIAALFVTREANGRLQEHLSSALVALA